MEINLRNKKALITGGNGGLGRTIALMLAECGADVAVHYNSNSQCAEQLVAKISNMGRNSTAVKRGLDGVVRVLAKMVAFLASEMVSFTTGAYIPVAGGNVMPAI